MTNQYGDSKQRRLYILKRLLDGERLSYQKLSEEYFVSRSSIANDLTYVKKIFIKEGLSLSFNNAGTYFDGTEVQIQKILKKAIIKAMDEQQPIAIFIDDQLVKKIGLVYDRTLAEQGIEIPEAYSQNIILSIALIIDRANKNARIQMDNTNEFGKLFLEFNKYPFVFDLLKKMEEEQIYHFSTEEIHYLTYLIVGSGLRYFMKSEKIPFNFRGKVRILIQRVSEGLSLDLTQDSRLEENLVVHLYQLIVRLEAESSIVNPLIDEIKQTYPALYGVVWFALADFCKPYAIDLSDDEVGFVSIHFQAAIERLKKMNKILFVCPNGIGTSSFGSAKIRRILPEINSIETASMTKIKDMDLTDVDFVISTVDIQIPEKKVVRITPMVTAHDMKKIMNTYIDLLIECEKNEHHGMDVPIDTRTFIQESIHFGNFASKEAALTFLLEQQPFSSATKKEKFRKSVWEREQLQTTYLDNGFAIPHGDPEYVEQSSIGILILDKPIPWGKQLVDIIVLLIIREEDVGNVQPVMEMVMQGINDKNWFIAKMMEVKK